MGKIINKTFVCSMLLGLLTSCSTDSMVIDESEKQAASKSIVFSDLEYKILGNLSKTKKIDLSEAKETIVNYMKGTRAENSSLQEIGVLTKTMLGSMDDSVSTILPDTLAYLFYSGQDESYMLIAADRRVDNPVLAIMKDGSIINENDTPEKLTILNTLTEYIYWNIKEYESFKESIMQELLEKVNSSVALTRSQDDPGYSEDDLLIIDYELGNWKLIDYVDELLSVEWDQVAPYNDKVKNKKSCGTVPTGCVATAVAQITSFWHYPASVNGSTLNWSLLTSNKTISSSETSKVNQVSTLMKVIGEGSDMDYDCSGSGTKPIKGRNWLTSNGYTGGNESNYNYSSVVSSLKSGCPVLASGYRELESYILFSITTHGHAWVIDGFADRSRQRRRQVFAKDKKTGQQTLLSDNIYTEYSKVLHNNWGWGGDYNGWFPEGCFDSHNGTKRSVDITRSDNDRNYQYNKKIYVGLKPSNR